ncbi:MAG: SWIM zinc finger family protein [Nitrospira sp.]|nr:SWIM zinc finger family protein [Nitrospira sp.]MDH4242828.1 SWIM zinc finger family protein [Nitrospira sp.]MDH4355757.1 SWIM zinc finger family protein [Nitrospira sp.]MDH5317975.1 SWIM zinc finger family protein [Nitrospira sp.]
MGKHNSRNRTQGKQPQTDPFTALTWDELQERAGPVIVSRGQRYQRSSQVHDLARTSSGGLVAWVLGSDRYATSVESEDGKLIATCTCPYGGICKHAVAVVLEYLAQVKRKSTIPTVTKQDRRFQLLEHDEDEEEWDEEGATDEDFVTVSEGSMRKAGKAASDAWLSYLEQQTQPQLLALLKDLVQRYPDVQQFIQDRSNLSAGAVPKMVKSLRVEIADLSQEPGWRNHWSGEGSIPDYSRVRDRLEALLAQGYADVVLEVGAQLLEDGTKQVEISDDEGETAEEIASCMDIVFRALPRSSRAPAEQMWWAVEADLADGYELCRGAKPFWDRSHPTEAWNSLADQLAQRLARDPGNRDQDAFSEKFQRDRLSNWLILTLERAGRHAEIIPLCRQEAEKTGSYPRLVEHLMKAKQWEEAEAWIRKGIGATEKRWPGIAHQLRTAFREMRERQQDWLAVAALRADEFFVEPNLKTFQALEKAAKRAGVGPEVRGAAMQYLETGTRPQPSTQLWPLPESGLQLATQRFPIEPPMTEVLIEIAIAEKRPDEVLRWYDRRKPRSRGWDWGWSTEDRIAEAVVAKYPERAVAIWKQLAEAQIALTNPKAYDVAAGYLRKVGRVLKQQGKGQEWQEYLAALRQANERKRRFVETLDTLTGRRIVDMK